MKGRIQSEVCVLGELLVVCPHCDWAGSVSGVRVRTVKWQCCSGFWLHRDCVDFKGRRVTEPPLLSLLCAKCSGKRVSFQPEGDFCWVVWDEVVLREELVDSVPPECERGLWTFDSVGEAEEVVEDSGNLVHTGRMSTSRARLPRGWVASCEGKLE